MRKGETGGRGDPFQDQLCDPISDLNRKRGVTMVE